jgi:hypothetical protein
MADMGNRAKLVETIYGTHDIVAADLILTLRKCVEDVADLTARFLGAASKRLQVEVDARCHSLGLREGKHHTHIGELIPR